MVCVTQDANGARLHHHGEGKLHGVLQPSFRESAEDVAMSDLEFFSMLFQSKGRGKGGWFSIPTRHPQHYCHVCVAAVVLLSC